MEQAIEVMRQSLGEPRGDGKATPLVGCVLVKPDGSVETGCRGELRNGDHAEYGLLERKNRDKPLDGSTLFTTLEPCAPGSRAHPKLSCAERIVNARIKAVWVGIQDPDPKVDRKGIKYLQDAGVEVEMFERDLQETITAANADFIEQALARAEEAKTETPKTVRLSELESPIPATALEDLSAEALEEYRRHASMMPEVGTEAFSRRLAQQGMIAEREGGRFVPTGFGLMLFGQHPRDAMPQAGLLATIHYPDGTEETRDFDGPLVLVPQAVEEWLNSRLPSVISRDSAHRKRLPPLPFEMVREGVVNALVHRDYDVRGAKCQLVVDSDSIIIKSPGVPVPPVTLEQLQRFNAPMLSRNPELHYAFGQMELAEERGLGIESLRTRSQKAGLPLPRFRWANPYLILTLLRSAEAAVDILPPGLADAMTPVEREGLQWIATKGTATAVEYARAMAVDVRTARRHLANLVGLGVLNRTGSGPSTRYEVL